MQKSTNESLAEFEYDMLLETQFNEKMKANRLF